MTAKDLRDLPENELLEHVATTRKSIFGLRFQHATGELARAITVARERDIQIPNRK